jgi:death on curing protein
MNWRWVSKRALIILHDESLATHGGGSGVRDEGLLDSALARPENLLAYADAKNPPDISALAAAYCVGLAKNHAFVDGNKRAAFLATGLFLYKNGYRLIATQVDATMMVLGVAAGDIKEPDFAQWLRDNVASMATR